MGEISITKGSSASEGSSGRGKGKEVVKPMDYVFKLFFLPWGYLTGVTLQ